MNNLLKTNGGQRPSNVTAAENESSGGLFAYDSFREDSTCLPPTDRHIVRNWSNLSDRYHGPCTLLALCNEFRSTLLSMQSVQAPSSAESEYQRHRRHNSPVINDAAKDLLELICREAGIEECFDLQGDPTPIRLPPKQLLLIAQTRFFQQADYATDLFIQSCFQSNVERVYNEPLAPHDEAWAICFNMMIVLVLGPGSLNENVGSQFVRPYLMIVHSALSNPRILMATRIVNVQALALLVSAACIIRSYDSLLQ